MAGGFAGDDETFEQAISGADDEFDEEENAGDEETNLYQDDDENNDDGNGEENGDDNDEENENGDDEEDEVEEIDEDQLNAFQRLQFEAEERLLKWKLKRITKRVESRTFPKYPFITSKEKETIIQAKKHKNLKADTLALTGLQVSKKTQWWSQFNTAVGPIIPYILMGLLILVAGIVLVATGMALFKNLRSDDDDDVLELSNMFGLKGDAIYGVRAIYKDDTKANLENAKDYYSIITNVDGKLTEITSVNCNDTDYDITVTINTDAKLTDYDWIDLSTLQTANTTVYNFVDSVAGKVYALDNGTNATGLDLNAKLNGIKYFGIDASKVDNLQTLVENYVLAHYDFAFADNANDGIKETVRPNVETLIKAKVSEVLSTYNSRSEKVFVKDYLVAEDSSASFDQLNYVGIIYLTKTDVEFSSFYYGVYDIDENNFTISLKNGTSDVGLEKYDGASFGEDIVEYQTGTVDLTVPATTQYVASETANGTSLFAWLKTVNDKTLYSTTIDDNGQTIYLAKLDGLHLEFVSTVAFNISEVDIEYETK